LVSDPETTGNLNGTMSTTDSVCSWLAATSLSHTISSVPWIIPTVQTVHILMVAAVMTSVLMVNMGLLRAAHHDLPMDWLVRRFLPTLWWALPVLLVTGVTLIVGEPARTLKNPVFYLKMALLLSAIVLMLFAWNPLQRDASYWHRHGRRRRRVARAIAMASLLLFVSIVFAGRWIAYVQGE
jgi:hypothetical protein